jgi:hypothetical protein
VTERRATFDPRLTATIVSRRPLHYRGGGDESLDRSPHVRAGSGLAWIGERLALVQDDANFVALIDPATGVAESITLPAGKSGLRQFDDARGNKKHKLDLESCCTIALPDGPGLLAFGSGSKKRRRRIALLDRWHLHDVRTTLIDAESFYLALEAVDDFAGSDLNIEGALAHRDTLRLFSRGNGAARGDRVPLNATCDLAISELLHYLADPDRIAPPVPSAVTRYALGTLDGLPLGFTDAARVGAAVLYTAAAEDSADAGSDGRVSGSVIGVLPARGRLIQARLVDARGAPTRDKVEGIASHHEDPALVIVVVDPDDASRPAELCEVRLARM